MSSGSGSDESGSSGTGPGLRPTLPILRHYGCRLRPPTRDFPLRAHCVLRAEITGCEREAEAGRGLVLTYWTRSTPAFPLPGSDAAEGHAARKGDAVVVGSSLSCCRRRSRLRQPLAIRFAVNRRASPSHLSRRGDPVQVFAPGADRGAFTVPPSPTSPCEAKICSVMVFRNS